MRTWPAPAFVFLAFASVPLAATAQATPEPPTIAPLVPEWAQIETMRVEASPGPALWRIAKNGSEVWILGMVGTLPKNVTWNSQHLADLMAGSRAIILPPAAQLDILDIGWFMLGNCCSLFRLDSGRLDDVLTEPTRNKLAALRESVGGDARIYQGDEPFGAAQRLGRDFTKKYALDGEWILGSVNRLAGQKSVKREIVFHFDPLPIVREAVRLTPQQQVSCLDAAMEDAERIALHARPMAEAWAVGDIRQVKAHFAESRVQDCLVLTVRAWGARDQNIIPAFVTAIQAALEKPGKTFVAVGIGPLLRKDGVLERLEAAGLTIEGPAE